MKLRSIKVLNSPFKYNMKYWWWPPARKKAKVASAIMGHIYQKHKAEIEKKTMDALIYGTGPFAVQTENPFGVSPVRLSKSMQEEINSKIGKAKL